MASDSSEQVLSVFRNISTELDAKHDKAERIKFHSQILTSESKRVIFLLHRYFVNNGGSRNAVMEDAFKKLRNMQSQKKECIIEELALEMENEDDVYKYARYYTNGLQEFIEALALWKFLKDRTLLSFDEAQEFLTFDVLLNRQANTEQQHGHGHQNFRGGRGRGRYTGSGDPRSNHAGTPGTGTGIDNGTTDVEGNKVVDTAESKLENEQQVGTETMEVSEAKPQEVVYRRVVLKLLEQDFMLGLADFTGELMRANYSAASNGDKDFVFASCHLIRCIYSKLVGLSFMRREMVRKTQVLFQSLEKMESASYNLIIHNCYEIGSFGNVGDEFEKEAGYDSGCD